MWGMTIGEVFDFLRRQGEDVTVGLVAGVAAGLTLGVLAGLKTLVVRQLQIRFIRRQILAAFEHLARIPDRGERHIFAQGVYTPREKGRYRVARRLLGQVRALLNHRSSALTGLQRAELESALTELCDVRSDYEAHYIVPKGFAHYRAVYREFRLLSWLCLPPDPPFMADPSSQE